MTKLLDKLQKPFVEKLIKQEPQYFTLSNMNAVEYLQFQPGEPIEHNCTDTYDVEVVNKNGENQDNQIVLKLEG